jgi:hypothetical protein
VVDGWWVVLSRKWEEGLLRDDVEVKVKCFGSVIMTWEVSMS